jgi:FtsH-binding integral membrane protein
VIPLWLQIPIVLALAIASWITSLDTTGDPGDTMLLWMATAVAGVLLAFRLLAYASRA